MSHGKGCTSRQVRSPLLLLADRALDGGDRLELLLGVFEFLAQALVLGLDVGKSLARRLVLVACRPRRRLTQARASELARFRRSTLFRWIVASEISADVRSSLCARTPRRMLSACSRIRFRMSRCGQDQPKAQIGVGPGVSCAAAGRLRKYQLACRIARREFVRVPQVLDRHRARRESQLRQLAASSRAASPSLSTPSTARRKRDDDGDRRDSCQANCVCCLSICRQLLFATSRFCGI